MEETTTKSTSRKVIQLIALFFLLVVFPAGSWFYLKSGFEYQKEAISELQDLGKVPSFQLTSQSGELLSHDKVNGKLLIVQFCDAQKGEDLAYATERIRALNDNFSDRKEDILFLTHVDNAPQSELMALAEKCGVKDHKQWWFLTAAPAVLENIAKGYAISDPEKRHSTITIVDNASIIRNHYQIDKNEDMRRLVEHIALVLPRAPEADII